MFRISGVVPQATVDYVERDEYQDPTQVWLPFSVIIGLMWKEQQVKVVVESRAIHVLRGNHITPMYTIVEVHPDSHDNLRRFMTQQGNPLWDVLHELQYNPQFGSQLETVKQHFIDTAKRQRSE